MHTRTKSDTDESSIPSEIKNPGSGEASGLGGESITSLKALETP